MARAAFTRCGTTLVCDEFEMTGSDLVFDKPYCSTDSFFNCCSNASLLCDWEVSTNILEKSALWVGKVPVILRETLQRLFAGSKYCMAVAETCFAVSVGIDEIFYRTVDCS